MLEQILMNMAGDGFSLLQITIILSKSRADAPVLKVPPGGRAASCLPGLPPGLSTQWSAFLCVAVVNEDASQAHPRCDFHVVG